jgi:hypothetical protein
METVTIVRLNSAGMSAINDWVSAYARPECNPAGWYGEAEDAMDDCLFNGDTYMEPLTMRYQSLSGTDHPLTIQREWFDVEQVEA